MAARGTESKTKITEKILNTFEGSFLNDKEIRIPMNENGELDSESDRADITLSLTFEHYSRQHNNL